ncbi:putative leucine-rich repeat-containing protein DDB_G0290503 [Physella acuta]|uniref:putative leucine-rich repeat-containing protein DDB_G0290503 n=1 Tax=Physella acuta TaxID=109671 RepID=UPI0027DE8FA4|nr:putative leucine-rich repeat-containing protein DDB_G0290503 [Physella acuta]
MSARAFILVFAINFILCSGLNISLEKEYYMEGKHLFCAKLHCVENTREDNNISALVNISVYRISELDGKIMLASVSESDSRVRDHKVTGAKVDGKFSKVFGELTVSFNKPSDYFSAVFGCDVFYRNISGLIEKKENKTKPVEQKNRNPLMLMTLEAKTPEFDTTIDRMSEFLKTFKDSDKLNSADLKMSLQFSTDDRHSNKTVSQINHRRELAVEERFDNLVNLTNAMEIRLNSLLVAQEYRIQKLENLIYNITNGFKNVENKFETQNKTYQELAQNKKNLNESLLKTSQQMEANNKTLELCNRSIKEIHSLYFVLNKQLEKMNYSEINVSLSLPQNSNQRKHLTKNMQDLKMNLLNVTKENIKDSIAIEKRQNISVQQQGESNRLLAETQSKTLKDLKSAVSLLNKTDTEIHARMEKMNNTIQNLITKSNKTRVLVRRLHGFNGPLLNELEYVKCETMNDRVIMNLTEIGVDVNRILCDTKTDGGGWIIIQGYNELRFDMKYKGKDYYAVYRGFKVENEAAKYKMSLTSFSGGNVEDDFSDHNGMKFTTIDSDNDMSGGNCGVDCRGATTSIIVSIHSTPFMSKTDDAEEGLDISLHREYYMEGKVLFCANLHCMDNTRGENEISTLVNMSVYRISELEGKIVLASVSESDSSVRDYKVTGSKVDGKFSKVFGELTVSFTKPADCFSTVFGCDVYYTNRRGLVEMKENKTKPVDQDNRNPLMLMTLEAKTPEFDRTIDRMSEFLKTFHDSDHLNSADLKMNLQFLTIGNRSNQIYHGKELHIEHRDMILANVTEMVEKLLNKTYFDQDAKIEKLNNKLNDLLRLLDVSNLIKTDQDLIFAVSKLNNTVKSLMSAVLKLKNTDTDLMFKVSQLNNTHTDLILAVTQINNRDKDLMLKVSRLNNTDKDLMMGVSKLNNTHNDLMLAVSKLNNRDKDLMLKVSQLNNTDKILMSAVSKLNNTDMDLILAVSKLNNTDKDLMLTVSKLNNKDKDLMLAVSQLNNTDNILMSAVSKLNNTDKDLMMKVSQLNSTDKILMSAVSKLNNTDKDLMLTVSKLNNKDKDLMMKVSQLNSTDKILMSAVSKLNNTDTDLILAVSQLNNIDKDLMSAVSKLNNTDKDLMLTVSKLNNKDKDLMLAVSQLNNTDNILMSAVSNLNNTDKDFKLAMFKFNNTNLELKQSVENINNTVQKIYKKTYEHGELLQEMDGLGCRLFLLQDVQIRKAVTLEPNRTACDMKTDGGGWIIIQRRVKGDVNFTRIWNDYKNGFGSTSGDFWIGNDVIYQLTKLGYNELRFDMKYEGKDYYAVYRGFKLENEAAKYRMNFTSFSGGNVENIFNGHKGMMFTTIDSDNDRRSSGNCAVGRGGGWWYGGWWYGACYDVNLNGEWASRVYDKGIHWTSITGWSDSLDFVEMKLRQM